MLAFVSWTITALSLIYVCFVVRGRWRLLKRGETAPALSVKLSLICPATPLNVRLASYLAMRLSVRVYRVQELFCVEGRTVAGGCALVLPDSIDVGNVNERNVQVHYRPDRPEWHCAALLGVEAKAEHGGEPSGSTGGSSAQ